MPTATLTPERAEARSTPASMGPPTAGVAPREPFGQRLGWHAASAAGTSLVLGVVFASNRQALLTDDKRFQYLPVAQDIGRRLQSGEWLPTIDPNLGPSGNYSLDVQYGLYDPSHWLVDIGLAHIGNLELAGFLWALAFEVLLTVGVSVLCSRLRVPLAWCAVAGVAAATSGWTFFHLAPDWMPGLVSLAWVPWLWWAWLGRSRQASIRGCLLVALFGWLVVTGGWPATWLLLPVLVTGWVLEAWIRRVDGFVGWLWEVAPRALALGGALVLAALTVLPLEHAAAFTNRRMNIGNDNFLTANVGDLLAFAAPQLRGDILTFGGSSEIAQPIYYVAWFAVVVLWTHRWSRGTWRLPGVPTCVLGIAAMVLLTQGPSTLGPIRDQIRELAGLQLLFVIGVCAIAGSGRWVLNWARAVGIGLSLAAMAWLTFSRHPDGLASGLGIGVEAVAAAGLLLLVRWRPRWLAVGALATTIAFTWLAFGLYQSNGARTPDAFPNRQTSGALHLDAADQPVFFATGRGTPADWAAWQRAGIGRAFADLGATDRMEPGYSSVSQLELRRQLCLTSSQGQACTREIQRLFAVDPVTHRTWADLLGLRTLVVARGPWLHAMRGIAPAGWRQTAAADGVVVFHRSGSAPVGRITDVVGRAQVQTISVTNDTESYRVSSAAGARLIFRDVFWPGYLATLDGTRIPLTPLHHTLVSIVLPKGANGVLTVSYQPLSGRVLVALPAAASALLGLGCLLTIRRREM